MKKIRNNISINVLLSVLFLFAITFLVGNASATDKKILRIIDDVSSINAGQIAIQPDIDSTTGVRMMGYKDSVGDARLLLVKDATASVKGLIANPDLDIGEVINLTDDTSLAGITVVDSSGTKLTTLKGEELRLEDGNTISFITLADATNTDFVPGISANSLIGAINEAYLAGNVQSVFGRTGTVVAAQDDYSASQIDNDSTASGNNVDDALDVHEARLDANDLSHLEMQTATKEPTGFYNPDTTTVTYNTGSRTVTLTGDVKAMYRNTVIPELVNGWESDPHGALPIGVQFLYYDGGSFVWSTSPWEFWHLQIAAVTFDGASTYIATAREVHGAMPWQSHKANHVNTGTYRLAGGDVAGYVELSTTPSDRRPTISETVICDEDLCTTNVVHNSQNNYTWGYLDGSDLDGVVTKGNAEFVPGTSTRLQFNPWNGAVWLLQNATNQRYISYWLVAFPASADSGSQQVRYFWIPGQTESSTIDEQRSLTPNDLTSEALQALATEYVYIEQVICYQTSNNWYIAEARKLTGSRSNQVSQATGGFLSTVSHDDTLDGLGTSISPLSGGYMPHVDAALSTLVVDSTTENNTVVVGSYTDTGELDITINSDWFTTKVGKTVHFHVPCNYVTPFRIHVQTQGSETINTEVDAEVTLPCQTLSITTNGTDGVTYM